MARQPRLDPPWAFHRISEKRESLIRGLNEESLKTD